MFVQLSLILHVWQLPGDTYADPFSSKCVVYESGKARSSESLLQMQNGQLHADLLKQCAFFQDPWAISGHSRFRKTVIGL